jgi:hypothetical protein
MNLSLFHRSNYYKGLLVLSRRDRIIDPHEKDLLVKIGEILDFDRKFCESAIDEILSNVHITREPIVFPDERLMTCFFHDALRLAFADGELHPLEYRWLRSVAYANHQNDEWLDAVIRKFKEEEDTLDPSAPFEIQKYLQGAYPAIPKE